MTSPDTTASPQHAREMEQPYTGPEAGHGIAALGGVTRGGLRSAMEFAEMILDTVREGLLVLDLNFTVQAANESFYRMFGVTREETEGRRVYDLQSGQWDHPTLLDLLERILPERRTYDGFELEYRRADGETRVLVLNARQVDHHELILIAFEDATERVRARESLEAQVETRTHQVRRLAAKLSAAEQEERQRIAHLLHDDLQQLLFGASMMLATLPIATSSDARAEITEQAQRALGHAIDLTRSLSTELSPALLGTDRLTGVFEWLAEQKRAQFGLEVTVEGEVEVADPTLRTLLFHLTREVLFNVVKHAETNEVRIVLAEIDGRVAVHIEDDGVGFDVAALEGNGGFGLASVRERLDIIGGQCTVASVPGQGTRVTLLLPTPPPDEM